jgi:hypothetical protein
VLSSRMHTGNTYLLHLYYRFANRKSGVTGQRESLALTTWLARLRGTAGVFEHTSNLDRAGLLSGFRKGEKQFARLINFPREGNFQGVKLRDLAKLSLYRKV